jgi:F-type H+-transporting ATPase subunit a
MGPIIAITIPKISLPAEELFHIGPVKITNSNLMMLIVMVALVVFFALATRKLAVVPGRRQAFVESAIEGLLGFTTSTAGDRHLARRIFPLIATLFIFILVANYSGLLPGIGSIYIHKDVPVTGTTVATMSAADKAKENIQQLPDGTFVAKDEKVPLFRSPNADLNMTLGMALIVVVLVQVMGVRSHGLGGYLKELATPAFLTPIHIIGELSRVISLSFRLFGNIFGGEVLVTVMYALTYLIIPTVFLGLEVFFGAIQALLFSVLTIIYISLAVGGHGEAQVEAHEGELAESGAHLG